MTDPTARDPHTVTICWTPDQNFGRVSCLDGRAPVSAVLGRLWAGEDHDEVGTDCGLSRAEVSVLAALGDEFGGPPGMVVDGDVLRDAITDAVPRLLSDEGARDIAEAALDGAVRAGMTVLHGPNHTAREVVGERMNESSVKAGETT